MIPSRTTELALLKICLVSKRYELQNVKPNEDMLRGKKEGNVGERYKVDAKSPSHLFLFFLLFFQIRDLSV